MFVAASFMFAIALPSAFGAESIAGRVYQVLDRRGLGADALNVVDNLLSHGGPPPPAAPPMVRELLKKPLAAVDVAALFKQAVPESLRLLGDANVTQPRAQTPVAIVDLLTPYINEVAAAQRLLRSAVTGAPIDARAVIKSLDGNPPSADSLLDVMRAVDAAVISRANNMFLDATARFIARLGEMEGSLRFPDSVVRFESAIGMVVIGTRGDDAHGADAALIIDPGGNDTYIRTPVTGGAVSIIIDLAGGDLYNGSDVVVHGLSAIVDVGGNDRYELTGPGLGAAIAGASLLLDFAGDDVYEAGFFAQGAAAFGLGAIIDFDGNDSYRIRAGGQGYGMAGGVGLLWDRAGNDTYVAAAGLPDSFDRGGGISMAQGAAFGYRTSIGGGTGILRDDAGEDSYTAEMFAQGVGFYYGIGILWDHGGNDRYNAVRYAQGNGVHEAIGVLRDESGNDSYMATVGVAQGMGLDLAVGVLYDGAGDDTYRGDALVQGAATANGIGMVIDDGGTDHWQVGADRRVWGWAEWFRGVPTVGLLLHDPARATFIRAGKPYMPSADSRAFGGPLGGEPVAHEALPVVQCPKPAVDQVTETLDFNVALTRLAPGFGGGKADDLAYLEARRHLTTRLRAAIDEVRADDFNASWVLGHALSCVARSATDEEIEFMWSAIENLFETGAGNAFAGPLMSVLRQRPPPAARLRRIVQPLAANASCGLRSALLRLHMNTDMDDESRAQVIQDARAALGNSCLRLQLAGRDVLRRLKSPFDASVLPTYLRGEKPVATP